MRVPLSALVSLLCACHVLSAPVQPRTMESTQKAPAEFMSEEQVNRKLTALLDSRRLKVHRKARVVDVNGDNLLEDAIYIIGNSTHRFIRTQIAYSLWYAKSRKRLLLTSQEFYDLLQQIIFTPRSKYFRLTSGGALTFNPVTVDASAPMQLFNFMGILLGLLLVFRVPRRVQLPLAFLKVFMGGEVEMGDLQEIDEPMVPQLAAILEGSCQDRQYFTFNGKALLKGGESKAVTKDNCHEYVRLMAKYLTETRFDKHLKAMKQGFFQVVPSDHLEDVSPRELQALLFHPSQMKRMRPVDAYLKAESPSRSRSQSQAQSPSPSQSQSDSESGSNAQPPEVYSGLVPEIRVIPATADNSPTLPKSPPNPKRNLAQTSSSPHPTPKHTAKTAVNGSS